MGDVGTFVTLFVEDYSQLTASLPSPLFSDQRAA